MKFQTRDWQLVNQLFSLRRPTKLCIARDSCFANIFMVDKGNNSAFVTLFMQTSWTGFAKLPHTSALCGSC